MDELVQDFLVETKDGLEVLDKDLIALESEPEDAGVIGNIFRVMHTIKGTCGFLGLQRLESIAHAGENILDCIRDGKISPTPPIVSVIFECVDQIKYLTEYLEENEEEPEGSDQDLIKRLNQCASGAAPEVEEIAREKPEDEEDVPNSKQNESLNSVGDTDALQAIFDATESLVDIHNPVNDVSTTAEGDNDSTSDEAENNTLPDSGDSDALQALFDATEPMVQMESPAEQVTAGNAKSEDEAEKEDVAKAEPVASSEPVTQQPTAAEKSKAEEDKSSKPAVKTAMPQQTIRVGIDVLERLMQHASELVLTRNQLLQLLRHQEGSVFATALYRLNNITTELQEDVMKTRMQPVGNAWSKLPRIVRDLSNELGKKIELVMEGEDTELDRQLLDAIRDPLTHMVRNSADHGIENPDERRNAGKSITGTVNLKAYQGGGHIIIEISDDGKGIDTEAIKKKVLEKGLATVIELEKLSESQILQFIFNPGFSTAASVTSVSGRGVGMDVVKSNIEKISGTVELKSEKGKGSKFTIKIPLTLAIMPILEVAVKGLSFAIPQINVLEIVKTGEDSGYRVEYISTKPVLRLRNDILPLVMLEEVLHLEGEEEFVVGDPNTCLLQRIEQSNQPIAERMTEDSSSSESDNDNALDNSAIDEAHYIVVCALGDYHFGIIVDDVYDTEEIVVKPVSPMLRKVDTYAGCTILGNGKVIMILDPNGIVRTITDSLSSQNGDSKRSLDAQASDQLISFVVFKAGGDAPKVVPLELLSRLEDIEVSSIEYSQGKPVVQYRDGWMHIMKVDEAHQFPEGGIQEFLVFTSEDKILGLAVEEIIDIAKCQMPHALASQGNGFMGSLVVDGKTCDVLDASYYYKKIFGEDSASLSAPSIEPGLKVVVVDDSPFFRKVISATLVEKGYQVEVFVNASSALDYLEENKDIHAIVTDMNMPGISGDEFLNLCRKQEELCYIPIISMSTQSGDSFMLSQMKSAGFDGYISKTNHTDLIPVIARAIVSKRGVAA